MTVFFTKGTVDNYQAAKASDTTKYKAFFQSMLHQGVHLPPAQFEAMFISTAHTDDDINETIEASEIAFHVASEV